MVDLIGDDFLQSVRPLRAFQAEPPQKTQQEKRTGPLISSADEDFLSQVRIEQRQLDVGVMAAQAGEETLGEDRPPLGLRADIGLSDTFEEKRLKFIDRFPDGDFIQVDPAVAREIPGSELGVQVGGGGSRILFRRNQSEEFSEFDVPGFEPLGDIVDITGDLPAIAMELLVTRGAGLARQALQMFFGNVAGEGMKETVEGLRGFQKEDSKELFDRAIGEAVLNVAAGTATVAISGPINILRGSGGLKTVPGASAAQKAAKAEGLPPLMPGQVVSNPLLRKVAGQSAAVVGDIANYIRNQNEAIVQSLGRLQSKDSARLLGAELGKLHDEAIEQITKAAKVPGVSLTTGGSQIQQGIAQYDQLANAVVNRRYIEARSIETPTFDVAPLKTVAERLKAGEMGPIDGETLALADRILALDNALPDRVVTLTNGETVQVDATDQLRQLREDAWGLKTPNVGDIARRPQKQASRLFGALQHSLKNPTNANDDFVRAWSNADTEAAKRFTTMDKLIVTHAMKSETPAQLANRLAQPLQVDNLRILKGTLTEQRYRIFQESVKADMISTSNIDGLTKRLGNLDKQTLDLLLTKEDQRILKNVGKEVDRLNNVGVEQVLAMQSNAAAQIEELVGSGQTARIDEIVRRAGPDPETQLRKSLRAGIMENIFNRTISKKEGSQLLDKKALQNILKSYKETGVLRLLTEGDRKVLANLDEYIEFVPQASDSGTSLQAASAAAGFRNLSATAFDTIIDSIGVGRLMTWRPFQRLLVGSGKEKLPFAKLRVLGGALATVATDLGAPEPQEP